jgi:hypothetical protein
MTLTIATAATGVARTAHYVIPTGQTQPIQTLLLEPQRTNLCIRSEEFDTWTDVSCVVNANVAVAPDGTVTADRLNASVLGSRRQRAVVFTGDGEKCVALYMQAGTSTRSSILLRDTTAGVNRHWVRVTWTAGVPSLSTNTGAGTLYPVEALANGWYRILFSATGIVAANTNEIWVYADESLGTGTVLAWGAQAENAVVPSSYIPTAALTVTRNADSLYFPFTAPPQAMTVYVRTVNVEHQAPIVNGAGVLVIGASTVVPTGNTFLQLFVTGGTFRVVGSNATGSIVTSQSSVTGLIMGDVAEYRAEVRASGAVVSGFTRNNGAEVLGSLSAGLAMPAAYTTARLTLQPVAALGSASTAYTHVVVAQGEQTMATMRQLAGVA